MTAINLNRRQTLLGLAACSTLPLLGCKPGQAQPQLLAAARIGKDRYALCGFGTNGQVHWQHPITQRAHDVCLHPQAAEATFFARRPGPTAWRLSLQDGQLLGQIPAADKRHFNGHGVYSTDGQHLYITQTREGNHAGAVGVYDTRSGQLLAELASGGLDPHQCLLLDNGATLVVANGGLLESDQPPRRKLNRDSMQPSLSWIDLASGRIVHQQKLDNHQLSIRHLAALPDGRVAVGLQYEGPQDDQVALVAVADAQQGLKLLPPPPRGWASFTQYVASVACSPDGRYLLASSPRGGCFAVWDLASGQARDQHALADVAGAIGLGSGFALSSGLGLVARWHPDQSLDVAASSVPGLAWDNHMRQRPV